MNYYNLNIKQLIQESKYQKMKLKKLNRNMIKIKKSYQKNLKMTINIYRL